MKRTAVYLVSLLGLSGCGVTSVVGAAADIVGATVSVAGSVVGAAVDITGSAVSGTIDMLTAEDEIAVPATRVLVENPAPVAPQPMTVRQAATPPPKTPPQAVEREMLSADADSLLEEFRQRQAARQAETAGVTTRKASFGSAIER